MRIIKLEIENIKRLVAVNISPDGNVVKISGKNGAGKTSVLDSIWWALGGTKNVQDKPIRDGQHQASIVIDLGELRVERKFHNNKSTLFVYDATGTKIKSPQKVLDNMLGQLTFDPLSFMRLDAKKQVAYLKDMIGLDFTELDATRDNVFERRTDAKRKLADLTNQHDAVIVHPETPDEPVLVSELMSHLKQANNHNKIIDDVVVREELLIHEREQIKKQLAALQVRINEIEDELIQNRQYQKDNGLCDVTLIETSIANATELNTRYNNKQQKELLAERVTKGTAIVDNMTDEITAIDFEKRNSLAKAKFPVAGLGFNDNAVTFNGIAFDQASFAEQLKVSTAMAMSLNPKLKVIRITDGSMLDTDSMAQLEAIAEEHDFQVWVEVVDDSGEVGIMIEDGVIANIGKQENAA